MVDLIARAKVIRILGRHGAREAMRDVEKLPVTRIMQNVPASETLERGHTLDPIEPGSMSPAHYPWAED